MSKFNYKDLKDNSTIPAPFPGRDPLRWLIEITSRKRNFNYAGKPCSAVAQRVLETLQSGTFQKILILEHDRRNIVHRYHDEHGMGETALRLHYHGRTSGGDWPCSWARGGISRLLVRHENGAYFQYGGRILNHPKSVFVDLKGGQGLWDRKHPAKCDLVVKKVAKKEAALAGDMGNMGGVVGWRYNFQNIDVF